MSSPTGLRVGIVGTGEMGRPALDRLRAAGHAVVAFARRPEARTALIDAGIVVVDSLTDLARDRDVVIVYVYTDDQVRDVALAGGLVDAMEPGSLLIVHTTGSPATARALAERAATRDVAVVDAPGSGGPAQVADGTLTLFLGGSDADVERARAVCCAYASTMTHVGPLGTGQAVKLCNNLLFGAQVELAIEAARLAATFGVDEGVFARTLAGCSGQSASLDLLGAIGSGAALVEVAGRFIHKDVEVARAVAEAAGAPLGTFAAIVPTLLDRTRPEEP